MLGSIIGLLKRTALITVATVSATIFSILQMISTRFGAGVAEAKVSDPDLVLIRKVIHILIR